MHAPRQLPKDERQRLVASIVGRRRVGSQHELRAALESAGCAVTQATISRDIRELGLEETSDVLGRPRYVLPGRRARREPSVALDCEIAQIGSCGSGVADIIVVQYN